VEKQIVIEGTRCKLGQISEFYSMRELKESNAAMWINVMVRINLTRFMIIH
jgi:hypothetical protein